MAPDKSGASLLPWQGSYSFQLGIQASGPFLLLSPHSFIHSSFNIRLLSMWTKSVQLTSRCNALQFQIGGRETNGQVYVANERTPQSGQKGESNMALIFLAWAARWTQILVTRIKKTRKGCGLGKAMRIKRLVWNEVSVRCLWHIQERMSSRQLEIMERFGLDI